MNKYKEALDEIKNIVLDKSGDGYRTPKYLQNFYFSSCETLQELVERATPKKLVATRHTRSYSDVYSFKVFNSLNGMKEKGYFKGIDDNELIGDILAKCEVVG